MSRRAVTDFCERVEKVIDYFRKEYKMTYAEIIGCLDILKATMTLEVIAEVRKEDDNEEEQPETK